MALLDFKLNSSPRPELFSSPGTLLLPRSTPTASQECPTPETPRLPGVPNQRPLDCPSPGSPWIAQPRVSQCPTPGVPNPSPWSAQPQSLPGVPNPNCKQNEESVFESMCLCLNILFALFPFGEEQGGDVRSKNIFLKGVYRVHVGFRKGFL